MPTGPCRCIPPWPKFAPPNHLMCSPYPCRHLPCTSPFVPNIPSTVILNFLWPMSLSCGWPMSHMLPTYLSVAEVYIVPSLCPLPIFSVPDPFPARMSLPVHMYTIIYYTIHCDVHRTRQNRIIHIQCVRLVERMIRYNVAYLPEKCRYIVYLCLGENSEAFQ